MPTTPTISEGAGSLDEWHAQDLDVGAARWQPGGSPVRGRSQGLVECLVGLLLSIAYQ